MKKNNDIILIVLLIILVGYHVVNKQSEEVVVIPAVPSVVIPDIPEPSPSPDNHDNDCDIALKNANINNKNLLIIFGAEWCGYCRSLKKDLHLLRNINQYESCFVDIDEKSNTEIVQHFQLKSIPTSIIVNPKSNKEIKRQAGYIKDNYETWLNR